MLLAIHPLDVIAEVQRLGGNACFKAWILIANQFLSLSFFLHSPALRNVLFLIFRKLVEMTAFCMDSHYSSAEECSSFAVANAVATALFTPLVLNAAKSFTFFAFGFPKWKKRKTQGFCFLPPEQENSVAICLSSVGLPTLRNLTTFAFFWPRVNFLQLPPTSFCQRPRLSACLMLKSFLRSSMDLYLFNNSWS